MASLAKHSGGGWTDRALEEEEEEEVSLQARFVPTTTTILHLRGCRSPFPLLQSSLGDIGDEEDEESWLLLKWRERERERERGDEGTTCCDCSCKKDVLSLSPLSSVLSLPFYLPPQTWY